MEDSRILTGVSAVYVSANTFLPGLSLSLAHSIYISHLLSCIVMLNILSHPLQQSAEFQICIALHCILIYTLYCKVDNLGST